MSLSDLIRASIDRISGRYDAEFDVIPGGPPVTWVDMELVSIIRRQQEQIHMLDDRLRNLEQKLTIAQNFGDVGAGASVTGLKLDRLG